MYITLGANKPILKEDCEIEFFVDNKVQQESLNKNMPDLLNFLKNKLCNYKINIIVKVKPTSEVVNSKYLSLSEKYKKLVNKNPLIEELKNQLNLDLEP